MTWDQVGELAAADWLIGAHTVTHPNLSELVSTDPTGERLAAELDDNLASIERHLGIGRAISRSPARRGAASPSAR